MKAIMPKIIKALSAKDLKRLQIGVHFVGGVGGLTLQVGTYNPRLGRCPASWVLRVYVGSRKRHLGLGSFPEIGLLEARNRALELKKQVLEGLDPVIEKSRQRAALIQSQETAKTFKDCAEAYLSIHASAFRCQKHFLQWRSTLSTFAFPVLGAKLVRDIMLEDVLSVLSPLWHERTETAKRLQNRIERVLDYAISCGYLEKANPARWKGFLSLHLAAPSKIADKQNFPSLPYRDLPEFMRQLHKRIGISARALEFLILTAVRSGTVRAARWSEIDFHSREWRIPKDHTKTYKDHRVPLTHEMTTLLESLPRSSDLIFPSRKGTPLSDMALTAVVRKMQSSGQINQEVVPHGFRSSFKVWAAERTSFPSEVSEIALMHTVGSAVYKAYQRSDLFEKRRELMEQWCSAVYG